MNHLKQIAARLPEYGLDAMLLNSEPGEYYAVGFHGEGNVVVTAQGCFYFTDSRYIEAANHLITGAEIAMTGRSRNYRAMVQEVVDRCRIRKLGFEEGYLSVADYNLWKEGLTAELVPAQKLVDALRARYGRDRLFLLGHSWGSLLGGLYALRRPEKLSAWLPVSQMVDFKRSEQVSAAEAIRRARGAGREEDAERLAQELEQVLALRRLDRAGAGALLRFRRRKERYLPPQYGGPSPLGGLAAPELTGNDLRWKLRFDRMLAANAALYEELLGGLSLDGCPPRYGVPVILTAGERDWTTPYPLAAAYYDTLSAPCKAFLSLPDAGHLPFRERPEEWSHILLDALAQI